MCCSLLLFRVNASPEQPGEYSQFNVKNVMVSCLWGKKSSVTIPASQ